MQKLMTFLRVADGLIRLATRMLRALCILVVLIQILLMIF